MSVFKFFFRLYDASGRICINTIRVVLSTWHAFRNFTFFFELFKFHLVFNTNVIFIKGTVLKSWSAFLNWKILIITVVQPAFHFVSILYMNLCFFTYMYFPVYAYTKSVRHSIYDGSCTMVISDFFSPAFGIICI